MEGKRTNFMGYSIDALTMDETVEVIQGYIKSKKKCQHGVLNAGKIVLGEKDNKLKNILNKCDIVNADGQSIVWASKLFGETLPERVAGIDLMERLLKLSNEEGYKVYFFGAKEETVSKVVEICKCKYINLKVAGYRNGYFNEEDNTEIIKNIKYSEPDILFLGFSSPKKEYWLMEKKDELNIPFSMGVGGSFDVIAGFKRRAPIWMQKCGLEWFYRFIQEPLRMWKRYLIGNIKFIALVVKFSFKNKFHLKNW